MKAQKHIHTIISRHEYELLKLYGEGSIKQGIAAILDAIQKKEILIRIETDIRI